MGLREIARDQVFMGLIFHGFRVLWALGFMVWGFYVLRVLLAACLARMLPRSRWNRDVAKQSESSKRKRRRGMATTKVQGLEFRV